jgi:transcriptional regulator with XRE-family HTH domain
MSKDIKKEIGVRIKTRREECGLSQEQLAEKLEMKRTKTPARPHPYDTYRGSSISRLWWARRVSNPIPSLDKPPFKE